MKYALLLLLFCSFTTRRSNVTEFICQFEDLAYQHETIYGIPREIKLAQAAAESRWGTSRGAVKFNAYFGIRAKGGLTYQNSDGEAQAYESAEQSFEHHSQVLCDYYQPCFDCGDDTTCWADCLAQKYVGPRSSKGKKAAYARLLKAVTKTIKNHKRKTICWTS